MARMQTITSVDTKIDKVQKEIVKVQQRYNELMVELEELRNKRIELLGRGLLQKLLLKVVRLKKRS